MTDEKKTGPLNALFEKPQDPKLAPSPEPASETPPRSRGVTTYIVLTEVSENGDWRRVENGLGVGAIFGARTPEGALEAAGAEVGSAEHVVVIPASSWHEFARTSAFKKVG